jgi:WhiB family transcriptional regulator, redox-sensing transcriptional regulator
LDQAACRDLDPERFFPEPGEQAKAAEAKAICAGCQVRDHCRDLAVKAAGGIDADHGVFGGTLPEERSPLRGNRFPEPSVYRLWTLTLFPGAALTLFPRVWPSGEFYRVTSLAVTSGWPGRLLGR